jgi:hypothetical protein
VLAKETSPVTQEIIADVTITVGVKSTLKIFVVDMANH